MRVAIRTDASPRIGSGHMMRMLTLAHALHARGASVTFLVRERPGDMRAMVASAGFELIALPGNEQLLTTWLGASYEDEITLAESAIRTLAPLDLVLVDHYSIDARWESRMRSYAARIAVVDDLFDRAHDCDVLLNQNLGAEDGERYKGLIPAHARKLLGPRFALLREEFRTYARAARERTGTIERVLLFMGGFDVSDETGKAIRALIMLDANFEQVDVVLPPEAPHAASVQTLCGDAGFAYRGRVESIAPLMNAADLSIGAMGSAAWERCVTGLPAIVVTVAENQRPSAEACARAGAVEWLGDAQHVDEDAIATAVESLCGDAARVRTVSERARAVVGAEEGVFSTDRVVDAFMEPVNV